VTVKELITRLAAHDIDLPVIVRCEWNGREDGDPPPDRTFDADFVVAEMDADTADERVIIECNQAQ